MALCPSPENTRPDFNSVEARLIDPSMYNAPLPIKTNTKTSGTYITINQRNVTAEKRQIITTITLKSTTNKQNLKHYCSLPVTVICHAKVTKAIDSKGRQSGKSEVTAPNLAQKNNNCVLMNIHNNTQYIFVYV